ncbi:MAG TPA: RluA family pseudouridine synthase [Streptosporangiaceae bacterium]|jgi:23S rRNA pseudouridine1911/1915/1917 synthase|nr:RluA family pseudouridine synthase [Streptosporangiaceae bacterium]
MTPTGARRVPVPDGLDGERLDAALARMFGLSRTQAQDLVGNGAVLVSGSPAAKSDRVRAGDWVDVTLPPPPVQPLANPEPVPGLGILYEDADIIVVDKPVGVAVHPTPGWTGPTVLQGLLAAGHTVATSGAAERQGIVHRLDAGTTGVMVVAKSDHAYSVLKQAFRDREVDKRYHALVQGHPDPLRGTIDAPIARHPSGDGRFAVVSDGRPSVTHYDTLEAFRAASLLEVRLETGRTHQIRVHMTAVRHPCVGDRLYGADPVLAKRLGLSRQWLHAVRLGFAHPADGRHVEFTSPYPADLAAALATLEAEA